MRTTISQDNPFGANRYGFAWEHIPPGSAAHLDFGCFDGMFLSKMGGRQIGRMVGADISAAAIERARVRMPHARFVHLQATTPLPFGDGEFTSVTMLDVIEHVHEQRELLAEIRRVMAPGATLIVTVPGQHIFSFLDAGNFKFLFPRLHRWYYVRSHSLEQYQQRYVSNPDGMIGDVSAKKRWHEHFSRGGMRRLLENTSMEVLKFDGAGFFTRALDPVIMAMSKLGLKKAADAAIRLDYRLFESTHLFCLAKKPK